MKNVICLLLILSTAICSAQSINEQEQMQQQRETQNIVIGVMVAIVTISAIVTVIFCSKAHRQEMAERAKFQGCLGKSKSDIYNIYGPPNSIVDDAQGQGGTILEYRIVNGGGNRKMFYLNKDNIVTAVKDDSR